MEIKCGGTQPRGRSSGGRLAELYGVTDKTLAGWLTEARKTDDPDSGRKVLDAYEVELARADEHLFDDLADMGPEFVEAARAAAAKAHTRRAGSPKKGSNDDR